MTNKNYDVCHHAVEFVDLTIFSPKSKYYPQYLKVPSLCSSLMFKKQHVRKMYLTLVKKYFTISVLYRYILVVNFGFPVVLLNCHNLARCVSSDTEL